MRKIKLFFYRIFTTSSFYTAITRGYKRVVFPYCYSYFLRVDSCFIVLFY